MRRVSVLVLNMILLAITYAQHAFAQVKTPSPQDDVVRVKTELVQTDVTVVDKHTFAQSARSRRETDIGPWLPEPVHTEGDPRLGADNERRPLDSHHGLRQRTCCEHSGTLAH